jgi:PAS domain S-box-containing protein
MRLRVTDSDMVGAELSIAYDALNSSVNGVLIADLEGRITYVNPAFLRMFEYGDKAEVLCRNAADLFATEKVDGRADVKAVIDEIEGESEKFTVRRKDGTTFPVQVSASSVTDCEGEIVGRMASFVDITARKEMEEQLVRQERLTVLGQLTGGVAHELRNPLGWIKGSAYLLDDTLKEADPEVRETLDILKRGVARCGRIVDSLLSFASPKPPVRREVNVNEVVREALSTTDGPENVEVVSHLDPSLPAISADPDQLSLVFGNIIGNAIQAMPEGGRLVVESETSNREWVSVSFTDTGVGIPEENLDELFEPLFTTRAKGTGLGLAIVRTLVEAHGGSIRVESELGEGSTFTVRLPLRGDRGLS